MRFRVKAGVRIDRFAFGENASHSIDGRERLGPQDAMKATNDRAIEISAKSVCTVSGKLDFANSRACRQAVIGDLDPFDACRCGQIEAQREFNDRTYDERLADVTALPGSRFLGKIETPLRIGLPKINTRPKPVIVIVARTKGLSQKYSLADLTVAAVIAENEYRSEPVQELSVVSRNAAGFGVDTLRHESLQGRCT